MKVSEIKELIILIDSTSLDFVKIENESLKLEVRKNDINNDLQKISKKPDEINIDKNILEDDINYEKGNNDEHIIYAPLMGTFYNCPNPDSDVFVKVGEVVEEGQTLCILEAMKMMNEISSDIKGEVVEIFVHNEDLIEYNQPLFKIKPL